MASQYYMDLLTVMIFLLIGYAVTIAEGSTCNSTIPHGRVNWYTCGNILNGQKCLYSCDPGYQTHRLSFFLSCDRHTGRWTPFNTLDVFMYNFPKFDEEVLCSPRLCPNTIPNGILSENCEAAVDSPPCNYTCKKGFVKTIQESLTCLHTGRWNHDLFSLCTAKDGKQCSSILPDADLDFSCDRRPGSTCTYQCRTPYYTLHSPPNILCQETDLTWSHKQVCSSVSCPRSFPGGQISVLCDMNEGSTCSVKCQDGYRVTNNSLQVTCLPSGQWSPNPSTICQKNALCSAYVPNGWISHYCSRRESETCSVYCNLGYTLTLPGMTTTCMSSGRWDVDLSNVCVSEKSLCSAYVPNGWISSYCSRRESETCSVYCNLGYTLTLPGMTTTCLSSGRWDVDLSNVCVFENRDSISSDSEAPSSSNIIIPLTLAIAVVSTIIVGIIVVCFRRRCQSRASGSHSPHSEANSSSHIPTMYSVGQCRIGCNLNLRSGAQTSFQAHDASPPPYTEVMKNNLADQDPPPSYEEVNASPSSFLPDSYM